MDYYTHLRNHKLKKYNVYYRMNAPFCYIGDNGGYEYPNLCIIFYENKDFYNFIEWNNWFKYVKESNLNIKDYILENNILEKVMFSINERNFSSGPTENSFKLIDEFRDYLMSFDDLKMMVDANTYNL